MPKTIGSRFDEPRADEVKEALARMLKELEFARNPSPARFLQFVVEETLAGRGQRLKAFAIATAALGRSDDFDPQNDSIVRVQAVRLRAMLDHYYAGPGAADGVRIALPRGAYRPKFVYTPHLPPPAAAESASTQLADEVDTAAPGDGKPDAYAGAGARTGRIRAGIVLLAMAAAAILALLGAEFIYRTRGGGTAARPLDRPPVVVIAMPQASPEILASRGALRFVASLEQGLASLDYVTVRVASSRPDYGRSDYTLTTRFLEVGPDLTDVDLILRGAETGDVLWSRQLPPMNLTSADGAETVGRLAGSAVGDVSGALFSDLHARLQAIPIDELQGYACRFAGLDYLRNWEPSLHAAARNCLEQSVLEDPENVGLLTTLSEILIVDYLDANSQSRGAADLQQALQMARRAYDLAPQRAGALAALFFARFFDKRFDDSFQIEQQAIATSPDSVLLALFVGRAWVSRGRYKEGIDWLNKVDAVSAGEQPIATAFLALADRMLANPGAEQLLLARPGAEKSAMGLTLKIIDCHERAQEACVQSASAMLATTFPGFASDVPAALDRYALAPPLRDSLLSGLRAAGFAGAN